MENGKIRHPNHLIDARAIQYLRNFFPSEWIAREMNPDYGIDLDLELFEYEQGGCITLGEHVFLQVKGTEHPDYGESQLYGPQLDSEGLTDVKISVIKYHLEVSMLGLVERMGSALPVLLIVVDLKDNQAYYICLNDYIRHILPYQAPNYKSQGTVTIYIPTYNKLSHDIFMWYGNRVKVCSLMQEIMGAFDSSMFSEGTDLVSKTHHLFKRINTSDAWRARKYWGYMNSQYEDMQEMISNNMVLKPNEDMVKRLVLEAYPDQNIDSSDDWKKRILYLGSNDDPEPAIVCAQVLSCDQFKNSATGLLGSFENDERHIGLPSYFGWECRFFARHSSEI